MSNGFEVGGGAFIWQRGNGPPIYFLIFKNLYIEFFNVFIKF